ncbi:MAG: hypothetical protein WA102_10730 [Candidatus Methanoperedens sp.]
MDKINKPEDIINILFNYVKDNFDKFGHENWWNTKKYGGSWSPFVETCFMLEAMKYGGLYKILCCYTQDNIKDYIRDFHESEFGEMYSLGKYPCRDIDVAWLGQNNKYFLVVEHSEDIPDDFKIHEQKYVLNYKDEEDNTVDGQAKNQLIAIRDEINKLKGIKSDFKVLISRPRPFKKVKKNNNWEAGTYRDSVNHFKELIEKDLKKDAASFNDKETWVIILITPDSDKSRIVRPNDIIFHCYKWEGKNEEGNLSDAGKYSIKIKKDKGKWVIDNPSETAK